jgi:hypothetical protein
MLLVGLLELFVAIVCCWCSCSACNIKFAAFLTAWLATIFLGYRLCLWRMHWNRPCSCLGSFTDAIHVSPQVADNVMKSLLAYLFIGSYGILFYQWLRNRKLAVASSESGIEARR